MKVEERSWNFHGLNNHSWFFCCCCCFFFQGTNTATLKTQWDSPAPLCPCLSPDSFPLHWGCSCSPGCWGKVPGHHHSSPRVFRCQIWPWLTVLHIPIPAALRRCRALVLSSAWELSLLHTPDGSAFVFSAHLSSPRLLRVMWIWEGKKEKTSPAANRKKKSLSRSFLLTCYLKTQRMHSRNIQNFLRKEGNQERGWCGMLLGIQTVWTAQAVLPLLQGQTDRHPSDQPRLD